MAGTTGLGNAKDGVERMEVRYENFCILQVKRFVTRFMSQECLNTSARLLPSLECVRVE